MRYTDHSRTALDDTCPKARYWGYEHAGLGITGVEPNEDLAFGLAVAQAVEGMRKGQMAPIVHSDDRSVLLNGLLTAYQTRIWPQWLTEFELIGAEIECAIPLAPDLTYMARPDAVIRRKADQTVWVLSDKTTSQNPENFVRQWDKAAQNHAECVAVEQTLGLSVSGFYTQGWYKGYQKAGTIYSPLAYAWCKEGQPGLVKDQWQPEYKYGWTRRRISEFEGGVAAWVQRLSTAVIQQQFPVAGPIGLRRDLVKTYLRQVAHREHLLMLAEAPIAELYPQRFQHCDEFSKFRRPCEFKSCCWVPFVGRDPIASGMYAVRRPHHVIELEDHARRLQQSTDPQL